MRQPVARFISRVLLPSLPMILPAAEFGTTSLKTLAEASCIQSKQPAVRCSSAQNAGSCWPPRRSSAIEVFPRFQTEPGSATASWLQLLHQADCSLLMASNLGLHLGLTAAPRLVTRCKMMILLCLSGLLAHSPHLSDDRFHTTDKALLNLQSTGVHMLEICILSCSRKLP